MCDWPVLKPTRFDPESLAVGDILRQASGWRAHVVALEMLPAPRFFTVHANVVAMGTLRPRGVQPKYPFRTSFAMTLANRHLFRVELSGTCDKPCCPSCLRSPSEDRDYCQDHWDAQVPADDAPRVSPAVAMKIRADLGRERSRAAI